MRVAVCDDEIEYINHISDLVDKYQAPTGEKIILDTYSNAIELMAAMNQVSYDLLLMDIIMPGFTGINAVKELRANGSDIPIIFLTTSPEYAVESYRVKALDYLMKPIDAKDFYMALDQVLAQKKDSDIITLATPRGVQVILCDQLVFVEIKNKLLHFFMLDGTKKEIHGRLADYEDALLKKKNFLKIHRSYIINMDLMKNYDKKCFIAMTGQIIPVSRNLGKEIYEGYINYLHGAVRK